MLHHHITIALAGAAAHFLTGWVLNCDLFLGKIWKQEKKECHGLSKDMRINIGAQILASIALSIATCVAIYFFEKSQIAINPKGALESLAGMFFNQSHAARNIMNSLHTVLFIWAGFILPVSAEEVIWCGHNWKHWMLEMVSELIGLIAIAVTVTLLS